MARNCAAREAARWVPHQGPSHMQRRTTGAGARNRYSAITRPCKVVVAAAAPRHRSHVRHTRVTCAAPGRSTSAASMALAVMDHRKSHSSLQSPTCDWLQCCVGDEKGECRQWLAVTAEPQIHVPADLLGLVCNCACTCPCCVHNRQLAGRRALQQLTCTNGCVRSTLT